MNIVWLTPDDPRLDAYWPGSLSEDVAALDALLESARVQCEAYAPTITEANAVRIETDDGRVYYEPPANYLHAQALQARALARAGITDGDRIGFGDHAAPTFPMDWTVQRLLRPQTKPAIA